MSIAFNSNSVGTFETGVLALVTRPWRIELALD
jgi:hypothetical protein